MTSLGQLVPSHPIGAPGRRQSSLRGLARSSAWPFGNTEDQGHDFPSWPDRRGVCSSPGTGRPRRLRGTVSSCQFRTLGARELRGSGTSSSSPTQHTNGAQLTGCAFA
jgi:hypothetical protein